MLPDNHIKERLSRRFIEAIANYNGFTTSKPDDDYGVDIEVKEIFLNEAADKEYVLFFEHDAVNECCTVQHTERGVKLKETFKFNELFS